MRSAAIGCAVGLPRRSASRHWLPTGSRGYQSGATTGASGRRARSNYFPARPLARQRRWLPRLLSCPPFTATRTSLKSYEGGGGGDGGSGNSSNSSKQKPAASPPRRPPESQQAGLLCNASAVNAAVPPPLATPRRPAFQPAPDTEATTPALYAADRRHGAHTPELPRCCDRGFRPPPSPLIPPTLRRAPPEAVVGGSRRASLVRHRRTQCRTPESTGVAAAATTTTR